MKKKLILSLLVGSLSGCAVKPTPLPQRPYTYNPEHSIAQHYANALGLRDVYDLPKGEAERLLKQREEAMIEAGLNSSLTGYVVSFAFAKSLGLPTSMSHDLATDTAQDHFILGAGSTKKKTARDYDNLAFYLPYELAANPEDARKYVFDHFINLMESMGLELEDVESEFKYGVGQPFTHSTCTKLDTQCRYRIRVKEPIAAYAPEMLGGYKAWVWSNASTNSPSIAIYDVANFSDLATFNLSQITSNEKAIQASFNLPLSNAFPDWSVQYKTATYNHAPYVLVKGQEYKFEKPE